MAITQSSGGGALLVPEREGEATIPLSPAQQRMWFLDQLEPGGSDYLIRITLAVRGVVDVAALESALTAVVARHAVLRTRYVADAAGQPRQVIDSPSPVPVAVTRLDGQAQATVAAHVNAAAVTPFDLAAGPVLRACLFTTGPDEAVLLICLHHIAFDGWSEKILAAELAAGYAAATGTGTGLAELPELAVQYGDYAAWQAAQADSPRAAADLAYWRGQLAGLAPLDLPTDHPRAGTRTRTGDAVAFTIPAATVAALRRLATSKRATLFMTLAAAFHVLLHRYTGQDDIAIGTPTAGRGHTETENLIGLFVNSLVLRATLTGDPTFATLLSQVKNTALAAYDHQDTPFDAIVEAIAPHRDHTRNPLFQAMLVLQNTGSRDIWRLPGLDARPFPLAAADAQLDLTIDLTLQGDKSAKGFACYPADLFDWPTIERMTRHYLVLLDSLAAAPDVPLSAVPMLTQEEQAALASWNDTAGPFPSGATIHDLVAAQAARTPRAPAVRAGDQVLTFAELEADASRLARWLGDHGVGPGAHVGVLLDRDPAMVTAMLAIMKAGAAYVPLDPDYPPDRLAYMLADTAAPLVITQAALASRLPAGTPQFHVDAHWDQVASYSPAPLPATAGPGDLAYVIYTSGSTGRPKGVMVEHQGIVSYLSGMQDAFPIRPGESFLQATPLTFDVSAYETWWPLWQGATVILPPGASRLDMAQVASLMRRHHVVGLHFVPSLMSMFAAEVDPADCPGLRYAFCSGEPLPPALVEQFAGKFGDGLINLYGATEVSVDTTFWAATPGTPVLAGRPMTNQRVYVLDRDRQPVPAGVVGEVYLGGQSVARGYLGRPELTRERFLDDPFAAGGRMYRTGDLGRLTADGQLDVLGRIDRQVKLRGVRIEPSEVEAAVMASGGVAACAVAVRENAVGDKLLVAYCVPAGGELDSAALRAACQQALPPAMVPAVFMALPALPLTSNGKVDRKRLPQPGPGEFAPATGRVAPQDEVEEALAAVWSDVLGVDRPGIHDNFFEAGGHSLRAVMLVNRVERLTGLRISLQGLFVTPTISGIKAQLLELIDAEK